MDDTAKKIKEWTDKMDYNLAMLDVKSMNETIIELNNILDILHDMETGSTVHGNTEVMEFSKNSIDTVHNMKKGVLEIRQRTLLAVDCEDDPMPLTKAQISKD